MTLVGWLAVESFNSDMIYSESNIRYIQIKFNLFKRIVFECINWKIKGKKYIIKLHGQSVFNLFVDINWFYGFYWTDLPGKV